ncbi:MAG: Ig-like domain-containing protein [Planctomycetes bacterium]|nr:Ig-like domain-containing protein [Planctomycetota bacterium]
MASIRGFARRAAAGFATASALVLALASTSCGGSGGDNYAAKPMVLVEYLYVDRALVPSFPTGVQALPRNAQIVFSFSEIVDPKSVNDQTIAIRYGTQFQTVPKGSFQVSGSRVIFDPTVTQQGTPNPFGLEPVTQYNVELPSQGEANDVVRNLDNDPLLNSFFSSFTTAAGFLRELDPPSIVRIYFNPDQNSLTKQVPGNAIMAMEFDEPMDPSTFALAVGTAVTATDGLDVRYSDLPDPNVNQANSVENVPIPGSISWDAAAKTFFFVPVFSFGDKKYTFGVQVFQTLKDLAGNPLINPRSFGPYVCDGTGKVTGKILAESFGTSTDNDTSVTSADWGFAVTGDLTGTPITSRRAYIAGYQIAQNTGAGQYNPIVDPLTGFLLNNYIANIQPPTNQGRRVMWACDDIEMGANGSVTTISWGPDSNATFAASYPDVELRLGFQKSNSLSLSTTFTSNFLGTPLICYKGSYAVAQAANVGNEYTPAPNTVPYAQMQPLLLTGYVNWPAPTSFFDWDQGDPNVDHDSVMLLDANVAEGNTFQQIRGWFGVTAPNSGVLLGGFPLRRMYATFGEDSPNPQSNFVAGIINPEPSWTDNAFTITKRVSFAQCRFYTPSASDPAGNAYPPPYSTQTTFGVKSNYEDAILTPALQSGGAQVLVEYQGAMGVDTTSNRTKANPALASTPFTTSVDDCDGYPYIRWRITLTSNLISNTVARLSSIVIPIERLP